MKKYYTLLAGAILTATTQTQAQTKIGGTGAPDSSAMLEVTGGIGNNKGILPPRLTTLQRDAIVLPAKGLMIYNTTANQLQINTGTPAAPVWTATNPTNVWNTVGNAGTTPAANFIGTTDAQPLVIRTNGTEKVRIAPDGSMGLGTNSPNFKLDMVGDATTNTGADDIAVGSYGATVNPSVAFYAAHGTELAPANLAAGNQVGKFDFQGWVNGSFASTSSITTIYQGSGTSNRSDLRFNTSGTEAMRIDSVGNIGIDDPTPRAPLSFASTTGSKIRLWDNGSDTSTYGFGVGAASLNYHIDRNTSAAHRFFAGGSNGDGTELMRIQSDGNVGIGTNAPTAQLDIRSADFGAYNGLRLMDNGGANIVNANMTPGYDMNVAADSSFTFDLAGISGYWIFGDHIIPGVSDLNIGRADRRWGNYYGENGDLSGTMRITGSTGTPTTITGRNATGDIGNVTLGTGLTLAGGVLSATPAAAGWALTGNAGTNPATNFIGTTDALPLIFRTSNTERARLTNDGQLVINNPGGISSFNGAGVQQASDVAIVNNDAATTVSATSPALTLYNVNGTDNTAIRLDFSSREANGAGNLVNIGSISVQKTGGAAGNWADGMMLFGVGGTGSNAADVRTVMALTPALNVGIGTTTPAQKLDVNGAARISGSAGTATGIMGRNAAGDISNLALGTNLSIAGGVLNATAPASGWALTGNAGTNPATNYIGTSDAQPLVLRTNAAERMRVLSNGNVGIGTNAPAFNLHVSGNTGVTSVVENTSSANGEYSEFRARMTGTVPAAISVFAAVVNGNPNNAIGGLQTTTPNDLVFRTGISGFGPVERMRIDTFGRIGIGTTTPQQTLHVQGGARITGNVGTPTAITGRNAAGDVGNVTLGSGLTLAGGVLSATPAAPSWGLTGNAGTNPATNYIGTSDAQDLLLSTAATERMRITAAGNVGIGTTTPNNYVQIAKDDFGQFGGLSISDVAGTNASNFTITPGYYGSVAAFGVTLDVTGEAPIGFSDPIIPASDNGFSCGTSAYRWSAVYAVNGIINTSDSRKKKNVRDLSLGLDAVMKLRPVVYDWKDNTGKDKIGFIAQELRKVVPNVVVGDETKETLGVLYSDMIPVLTKAIQELNTKIATLETENKKLRSNEAATAQLVERVKQMEQMMGIKEIEGTSKVAGK